MADFAGLPRVAPEEAGLCPAHLDRMNRTMAAAAARGEVPGVVTVIMRGGKVAHTAAHGFLDMERKTPLALDSLFRMYSQTKPITAVLLMRLQEEGLLFIDEPISKFLPEFANRKVACRKSPAEKVRGEISIGVDVTPARREITVFDLLTMTSGLPSRARAPAAISHVLDPAHRGTGFLPGDTRGINDPPGTYEDMVLALARAPLHAHPGETWQYGSDFDVLTLLIQRATGKPLDELMRTLIFEPLGMSESAFYCPRDKAGRLVTEYQWDPKGRLIVRDPPETSEKTSDGARRLVSGNGLFGGVVTTPADYTRFARMLAGKGALDGQRIIGRKSVELMTTDHLGGDRQIDLAVGPGYGFGFGYAVRKTLRGSALPGTPGAFGWGGAAGTWFFVDPAEDLAGLFFTHVFGYQFSPLADLSYRFEKMTYEALL